MANFKQGDRVQRVETGESGTIKNVNEDPTQIHAPEWYSVLWDGATRPEDMVYPRQLKFPSGDDQIKKTVIVAVRLVSENCIEVSRKLGRGHVAQTEMVRPGRKYRVEPPALCQPRFLDFTELQNMGDGEHILEFYEEMQTGMHKMDAQKPSR